MHEWSGCLRSGSTAMTGLVLNGPSYFPGKLKPIHSEQWSGGSEVKALASFAVPEVVKLDEASGSDF
jgi:hypothetical protein